MASKAVVQEYDRRVRAATLGTRTVPAHRPVTEPSTFLADGPAVRVESEVLMPDQPASTAATCEHDDCRVRRGEWNESLARIATFGNIAPCPVHGVSRAKRIGDVDAEANCRHCGQDIIRRWYDNGGWLWEHRATNRTECNEPMDADPDPGTVTEVTHA